MDQIRAFLDMLAYSEIGPKLLAVSNNGYDVCVGSTPEHPILFTDYSQHPGHYPSGPGFSWNAAEDSDAAGRYQEMGKFWPVYKQQLQLPDFSPASQDKWAIQLIRECGALDDISNGHLEDAIYKCRSRWTSLPGANYPGQRMNSIAELEQAFVAAGGIVA